MRRPQIEGLSLTPIGVIHTPFTMKVSAPRQPALAPEVQGRVQLFGGHGYEDALSGLETFDTIWLIFGFHLRSGGFRAKVRPPRSAVKRGVFATRSPHRPNAIGLSAVKLARIDGLDLYVRGVDMIDQTPIYDIKPYIAYTDSIPSASHGWLEAPQDPAPRYEVEWSDAARAQAHWLAERGISVASSVETALGTGPHPHAYRRIRDLPDGTRQLAIQAWRFHFVCNERKILIEWISTGYRPSALERRQGGRPLTDLSEADVELEMHRQFVAAFGARPAKPGDRDG